MELPRHIAQILNSLAEFSPSVIAQEGAHRLQLGRDTKVAEVLWPDQVGEVFFDFMKDGELLLAESVEYYENETRIEQAEDVTRIIQNFLLNEVRVVLSGQFLKRQELQSCRSGQWLSVFKSAAQ